MPSRRLRREEIEAPVYPVVGRLTPARASVALRAIVSAAGLPGLQTRLEPWGDYDTSRITGMARVRILPPPLGRRLDLLAIDAKVQWQGHCREFIRACQQEPYYDSIAVWEIENQALAAALYRWGFRACREDIGDVNTIDGRPLVNEGMRWVRGSEAPLLQVP